MRAVVLVLVLVVLCALALLAARRHGPLRRSKRASRQDSADGTIDAEFPLLSRALPPPEQMLEQLRHDRPRLRRRRRPGAKPAVRLLRGPGDYVRCDGAADHYTEDLRVRAGVGPEHFSLWSVWANRSEREIVQSWAAREAQAAGRPGPTAEDYRTALARYAGPAAEAATWDTHPALALYVLRRAARRFPAPEKLYTSELSVLDAGPGWGAQLVAACAAEVREYHAYLPYQSRTTPVLAQRLEDIAAHGRPADAPQSAYYVRQLEVGQANPPARYHVAFIQAGDLTPLYHVDGATFRSPAWDSLLPGGWLVLFCPPTAATADRVGPVLERLAAASVGAFGDPPRTYEAAVCVEGAPHSVAYVWAKTPA